jgi:hypothetical protein
MTGPSELASGWRQAVAPVPRALRRAYDPAMKIRWRCAGRRGAPQGVILQRPEDVRDDWTRQALINEANRLYGGRGGDR